MVTRPARTSRTVLVLGTCLVTAATLVAVASPADASRRPAPTHFKAPAVGQGSVTVRWHKVRKAPGYRVRWSTRHSMTASGRLATTGHRVRIDGLAPDTRYFVQVAVAARKGHGRRLGPWSRILKRRTPPAPCPTVGDLGDPTPAVPSGEPADLTVATFNIRTITLDSSDHPEQRWRSRADRVASLLLGAPTTLNAAAAPPEVIAVQEANQSYRK
ncbi:MAG TPA: fibronectin type III domain-containing protein, partial [Marmoricola sp.]